MPAATSPGVVFLDDGLGRGDCACLASCRREIGGFRIMGSTTRGAGASYSYVPMLPGELASLPADTIDQGLFALAIFDLDAYPDFDGVMETARTSTEKRGRINREVARAEKNGYYVKPFAFALHVPDIVEIHNSKDQRDGRPVKGAFYHRGVEDMGGAPTGPVDIPAVPCSLHHETHWGVFLPEDGYCQGAVRTDERLVGYISLLRRGNSAWYSRIMGHGDHLKHGIMYQLHYELVRAMLADRPSGLRYLAFFEYVRSESDQRLHWKKLLLFKPYYLLYGDDRAFAWPGAPPEGLRTLGLQALSATLDMPWARAVTVAAKIGIGARWLELLHRAWVVERARAPGLVAELLRADAVPSLRLLRAFAPNLFPADVLDGVSRITVLLTRFDCGIDTLLPLHERGLKQVTIVHPDAGHRAMLTTLYDPDWIYGADAGDADLVICDGANPPDARRLLISVADSELQPRTGANAGHYLSQRLGRAYVCRSLTFRHGAPSASWAWLEPV